ncbi:MAG: MASE3 domain-containing protein [Bacillota bacterium]
MEKTSAGEMKNSRFAAGVAALLIAFLALNILAGSFYFIIPQGIFVTIHTTLEFASIIVAMSVSLMSWYEYRYKVEVRSIILSATFCAVGLVDFAHTLSYAGMTDFISPNSVHKASTLWILARIIQSLGILAAVCAGKKTYILKRAGLLLFVAAISTSILVYLTAVCIDSLPLMYDAVKKSQTPLKIGLEYIVMAAMSAGAFLIFKKKEKEHRDFYLAAALLTGVAGEMAFTLYSSAYDGYNLLGNIYKILSFGFILKALVDQAVDGIYRDNTGLEKKSADLAEMNRQLRIADRLKNNFLDNINHELKTPLSAIVAFTELIMDEESTGKLNELQKDYLKEIRDSSLDLTGKIKGLLELSGVLGGKVILNQELVSVKEILSEVAGEYEGTFCEKGIALSIACDGDLKVVADRGKLSRILINLLENARKFTDPGGAVEITAAEDRRKREVHISVRDTGVGIDNRQKELIFNMFYQVDGASTRKYGGTGIGLTLAARLTEMHGGRIDLESQFGKGSRFTVILPVPGSEEVFECRTR